MLVPDGSILTWQGSWKPTTLQWIEGSGLSKLDSPLAQQGLLLKSSSLLSSELSDNISASLVVQTTGGIVYGSEDDVASLIAHAIYVASGSLPTGNEFTNIVLSTPGQSANTASIETAKPICASGISGWFSKLLGNCSAASTPTASSSSSGGISGFISSITSHGILTIGLVIFGFVGALFLIGYSGQLRKGTPV